MNLQKKILNILSLGTLEKYSTNIIKKIQLINILIYVGLFFLTLFSITSFYLGNFNVTIILIISVITLIVSSIYLTKTKNYKPIIFSVTIVFSLLLLLLLIFGKADEYAFFWFYLYPVFMIYLHNYKRGFALSVIIIFLSIIIFYLPFDFIQDYEFSQIFRFVCSYLALSLIIFLIKIISEDHRKKNEQKILLSRQLNNKKTEIISKISFQIRTRLINLLGSASLLRDSDLTDIQLDYVNTIEASINNLTVTIESIDVVSSIEKEKSKSPEIEFNILTSIKRIIDLYLSQNKDIKINLNIENNTVNRVIGNPVRIKQIFLNIIDIFFLNKTTRTIELDINISLIPNNENIINYSFEIKSDTNIMILKEKTNNDAITLNITKNFITGCGGKFRAKTEENFSSIIFNIPYRNKTQISKEKITNEEEEEEHNITYDRIKLKNAKILLVEDDEINQKIIKIGLKKYVKHIDIANNGKDALLLYESTKYHCIILDLQMPVMDGFVTAKKIRETEIVTSIRTPIIALTANTLVYDKEICAKAGMDEYITKPFKMNKLVDVIYELISK